ncbi:RNA-directed DNA polymerase, eukaryota, reverse transcriptase zinc-binding domain protein, partial [Tanacetum coccineum]
MWARQCRLGISPGKKSHSSFPLQPIPGDKSPGFRIPRDKSPGNPQICPWGNRSMWGNSNVDFVAGNVVGASGVNVYGPQGSHRKDELWRELLSIMSSREAVWILFGDFNTVRSHNERFGTLFVERDAKAFNEFISNGGLHELPMGGRR